MERLILIVAIAVFFLLLLFDITGHRKRLIRRKASDWLFLCLIIVSIGLCSRGVVKSFHSDLTDRTPGQYLAYNYLLEGDTEHALDAVAQDDQMSDREKTLIRLFAYALDKDYSNLFFESKEFAGNADASCPQADYADELYSLALTALEDDKNITSDVKKLLKERYADGVDETDQLSSYFELDKAIKTEEASNVDDSEIESLLSDFQGDSTVMKLAIRYYNEKGEAARAEAVCLDLIAAYDTAANNIIYADTLAQQSYISTINDFADNTDSETAALIAKSNEAAEKAAATDSESKSDKQTENAYEYREEASLIVYERVLNYTNVKCSRLPDQTGLYELERVKAELLCGNYDSALAHFNDLRNRASLLDDDSAIKDLLLSINSIKAKGENEGFGSELKEELYEKMTELIRSQGQGVVPVDSDTVNKRAASLLFSLFIYDIPEMLITDIDTSSAKILVDLNMNIAKDNVFGGKGEFYADDMTVTDNGTELKDFSLQASMGSSDRNLSIAAAMFDNDAGDLGLALRKLYKDSAASRYEIIGPDASVLSSFGDSEEHYMLQTRNINTIAGKTSLYEICGAAISDLCDKADDNRQALIICDTFDLNAEQLRSLKSSASENSVRLNIITLDSENEDLAKELAEDTGGMYRVIDDYVEIYAAADSIITMLNNSYEISFKPDNEDESSHSITVTLNESGLTAEKEAANESE